MVLGYFFTGMVGISIFCALLTGNGQALSAAAMQGAGQGITLALGMAGSICLWCGVNKLMTHGGITALLSRGLRPVLQRLFPSCKSDPVLLEQLTGNVCANILGLGNAATPMGIAAAKRLPCAQAHCAGDELCRLMVLNSASIQLIPTNVAALRSALGCRNPLDILPAVWASSLLSAGVGVGCAVLLAKVWKE